MSPSSESETEHVFDDSSSKTSNPTTAWKLPYYAVIFTSRRPSPSAHTESSTNDKAHSQSTSPDDYGSTAKRMFDLAQKQPGYLGFESHKTVSDNGSVASVTVSYWTDLQSIKAWRAVGEHAEARRRGKAEWYSRWNVRVAKVEREYGGSLDDIE